jgi:ATP phosphoribosyltransferase regulatory subunit HisZ
MTVQMALTRRNAGPRLLYYIDRVFRLRPGGTIAEFLQVGLEILEPDDRARETLLEVAVQSLRVLSPTFTLDVAHRELQAQLPAEPWNLAEMSVDPTVVRGRTETLRLIERWGIGTPEQRACLSAWVERFAPHVVIDLTMTPLFPYYTGWLLEGFVDFWPHEVLRGGEYVIGSTHGMGFAMEFPYDALGPLEGSAP